MRPVAHDRRIVLLALGAALPGVVTALAHSLDGRLHLARSAGPSPSLIVLAWLGFTQALRERVVRPLQTVSNLLAAMREEDFSIRARGARGDDPLGEVLIEVNALAETLREQRLGRARGDGAALRASWRRSTSRSSPSTSEGALQLVNRVRRAAARRSPSRGCAAGARRSWGSRRSSREATPQILEAGFPGRRGPLGDPAQRPSGRAARRTGSSSSPT